MRTGSTSKQDVAHSVAALGEFDILIDLAAGASVMLPNIDLARARLQYQMILPPWRVLR